MKCVFQLIDAKTGVRTEPVSGTREEFADKLVSFRDNPEYRKEDDGFLDNFVLCVAEQDDDGTVRYSTAPIYSVSSFISYFGPKEI